MENAEEILQCLDEFTKLKPKDIPRELEEYLCFVAKTGDPVYQWPLIKCLFREKLLNVMTEFYETCPLIDVQPCRNVDSFNYDGMKNFILEKLDTFASAPFTVQRICELLTAPKKEYNRVDKYMRALEKNILVVSTREPGNRKSTENGESVVNGLESEHLSQEIIHSDINVEVEMDDTPVWSKTERNVSYVNETNIVLDSTGTEAVQDIYISDLKSTETATCSSSIETVITSRSVSYIGYTPNITDLIIEPSAPSEPASVPPDSEAAPEIFALDSGPQPLKEETTYAVELDQEPSLAHMDLLVGKLEVPESTTQPEPESSATYEAEQPVTLQSDTTISSTEDLCPNSSDSTLPTEEPDPIPDDQVTESHIENEYMEAQSETTEEITSPTQTESEPVSTQETETENIQLEAS